MKMNYLFRTGFLMLGLGLLIACSEDNDDLTPDPGEPGAETYETNVFLTDSPIDNAEVEGVFVTIAEVWINGEPLENFEKTSIDVSSLHSGNTELLGSMDLESGTTSEITLVLDNETDTEGETPGHYVLAGGEKRALTTTSNEIELNDQVEIGENDENEIVLDFDLRKAVVTDENGEYHFASDSKLASSIRAVNTQQTGTITGTVTDFGNSEAETMVVYAYKAGSYEEGETQTDEEGARFPNAVNSSIISEGSGDFELHFMEEGDYELRFFSYSDNDADEQLEFEGELEANSSADSELNLLNLNLASDTEVDVDVVIIGLLDL